VELESLTARNFRNLSADRVSFETGVNLILGANGQGKTNLLEAVYTLGTGRSFRTAAHRRLVVEGGEGFRLEGRVRGQGGTAVLEMSWRAGSPPVRDYRINGVRVGVGEYLQVFPMVVLSAADRDLVTGRPAVRRAFLDRFAFLLEPAALREFGIRAEFARPASATAYRKSAACFASSARHEVMAGGRKVAAGAQRRLKGGLLLHGSIVFGLDRPLWESVLGAGVAEKTASIGELARRRGGGKVKEAFTEVFIRKLGAALGATFQESGLTEHERRTRESLMHERYANRTWNELAAQGAHRGGRGLSSGSAGQALPGPMEEMKKAADW